MRAHRNEIRWYSSGGDWLSSSVGWGSCFSDLCYYRPKCPYFLLISHLLYLWNSHEEEQMFSTCWIFVVLPDCHVVFLVCLFVVLLPILLLLFLLLSTTCVMLSLLTSLVFVNPIGYLIIWWSHIVLFLLTDLLIYYTVQKQLSFKDQNHTTTDRTKLEDFK